MVMTEPSLSYFQPVVSQWTRSQLNPQDQIYTNSSQTSSVSLLTFAADCGIFTLPRTLGLTVGFSPVYWPDKIDQNL